MEGRIAIVGAGIIGCLVALEAIAAYPSAQITLIERGLAAEGASQRSAGVHFAVGRTERVRSMSLYSQRYYTSLASRSPDIPIFPLDFYAVSKPAAASELRQRFVAPGQFHDAPDRHWVTGWPKEHLVWSVPGCHYADVGKLVSLIARQLRDRVTLLEGLEVESIAERRDGIDVRLTTGDKLSVEKLIIAPGPWVNANSWHNLTRPLGVRIKKIVAMHFDHPMEELNAAILYPEVDAFIVPLRNRGHWLFSYTCDEWDVSPDDLPRALSDRNFKNARDILYHYAPDLVPLMRSGRVFCDAYSPSGEPLITVIGESGNVIFAGAANGSGYRLAPGIAAEAVRLLNQS